MSLPHHNRGRIAAKWFGIGNICFLLLTLSPRQAGCTDKDNATPTEARKNTDSEVDKDVSTPPIKDPTAVGSPDPNADVTLLLEVYVNGHSIGKIGEFTLRQGKLMARPSELRDLGFKVLTSFRADPDGLISLSDMPGVIFILDQKKLELNVTVGDERLRPTMLQASGRGGTSERRVVESGTGMTLNYDTVGTFASGNAGGTGSMDLRAFSSRGTVSTGWLGYAGASSGGAGSNTPVRLDSAYTFADVNTMRRYSLGDFITGGLAWTRPVRLEGGQINSDFSTRPDLITFPLPTISGSAAVPSTVNILTDGNLAVSSDVSAGPFEVPQLPVVSGAGTISMTVTNALGQQVTLTQPFYASSALLAKGLQTYAVQSGLVRRNWGSVSNDYGKLAGTAIFRRGLTPKFTVEGSAEGTSGTFLAGGGGVAQIGHFGVLNFAASASTGSGRTGEQLSAGAQRIGRVFSLGGSAMLASRYYRDVASMNGAGVPRKQLSAFTSLYLRRFGSLGAAYAGVDQDVSATLVQLAQAVGQHSHVASANYSYQFRRASVYATAFKNISATGTSGSNGMQFGVTVPLGRRSSVNASATTDGNGQLQAQKSAALIGEWGYNAYVSAGNSTHAFGQVQYKSPVGLFTAGLDQSGAATTLRAETQGAISFVDRGVFPSNTIYDSFAIVDTNPIPHVRVLQENRNVGSTNSSGRLLVPDMRSFDLNHLAVDATDIPPDVTMDLATREMRPQDRSGVVVKFPIKISHGALLKLVDQAGVPMPIGTSVTLKSTGVSYPVGYAGDAYLEDLGQHNVLTVEIIDGKRCSISFDYKAVAGDIPSIGPLRCAQGQP